MDSTRESEAFERLHRPYASMNWIRFNGSLRHNRQSRIVQQYLSPLPGPPLVNVERLCSLFGFCQPCSDKRVFRRLGAPFSADGNFPV